MYKGQSSSAFESKLPSHNISYDNFISYLFHSFITKLFFSTLFFKALSYQSHTLNHP